MCVNAKYLTKHPSTSKVPFTSDRHFSTLSLSTLHRLKSPPALCLFHSDRKSLAGIPSRAQTSEASPEGAPTALPLTTWCNCLCVVCVSALLVSLRPRMNSWGGFVFYGGSYIYVLFKAACCSSELWLWCCWKSWQYFILYTRFLYQRMLSLSHMVLKFRLCLLIRWRNSWDMSLLLSTVTLPAGLLGIVWIMACA